MTGLSLISLTNWGWVCYSILFFVLFCVDFFFVRINTLVWSCDFKSLTLSIAAWEKPNTILRFLLANRECFREEKTEIYKFPTHAGVQNSRIQNSRKCVTFRCTMNVEDSSLMKGFYSVNKHAEWFALEPLHSTISKVERLSGRKCSKNILSSLEWTSGSSFMWAFAKE